MPDLELGPTSEGRGAVGRPLSLSIEGRRVPGMLWQPAEQKPPHPLVVFGHGVTHDSRSPLIVPLAELFARRWGIASLALDAPGHGGRKPAPDAGFEQIWGAYRNQWRADAGAGIADELSAVVDLLQARPELGAGPMLYWGLSLGTQYGLAWLARDRRPRAAVLGLFGAGPIVLHYAGRVRCPVLFVMQQDDQLHPAEGVRQLFDGLASDDKQLVASPGLHDDVPRSVTRRALEFAAARLRPAPGG